MSCDIGTAGVAAAGAPAGACTWGSEMVRAAAEGPRTGQLHRRPAAYRHAGVLFADMFGHARRREGTFYPDEIEIQEAHAKHRKLDSQTTLSHRARGRALDGRLLLPARLS